VFQAKSPVTGLKCGVLKTMNSQYIRENSPKNKLTVKTISKKTFFLFALHLYCHTKIKSFLVSS